MRPLIIECYWLNIRTYLIFWCFFLEEKLRSDDVSGAVHDEVNCADSGFLRKATDVRADHCHWDRHCGGVNPHQKETCITRAYWAGGIDKGTANDTIERCLALTHAVINVFLPDHIASNHNKTPSVGNPWRDDTTKPYQCASQSSSIEELTKVARIWTQSHHLAYQEEEYERSRTRILGGPIHWTECVNMWPFGFASVFNIDWPLWNHHLEYLQPISRVQAAKSWHL